jgi:hypothetical protein
VNPLPPLLAAFAIAAGTLGGFELAAWASPDLPSPSTDPGVSARKPLRGDDPRSLFHATPLAQALSQTEDQFPAGNEIVALTVNPDSLRVSPGSGEDAMSFDEVPVTAPERMIGGLNAARERAGAKPVTLNDVSWFSLAAANPRDEAWSILLDIGSAGPPSRFVANRSGSRVRAHQP